MERLGEGRTAVVYRALDPDLEREIAVKVLRDPRRVREVVRKRFLREGRVLAGLAHPNLLRVFDVGLSDDEVFLAIELVKGRSLEDLMKERPDPRRLLEILEEAARGGGASAPRGGGPPAGAGAPPARGVVAGGGGLRGGRPALPPE